MKQLHRTIAPLCVAAVLALAPGCRTGKSMVDLGPDIETARATVSGAVLTAGGEGLGGRTVQAVSVDGTRRASATTNVSGGYTLQVPPGRYRLEVVTTSVETVVKAPAEMDLGNSEMETGVDFVVGPAGS
jgi:hypothetical protein